MINRLKNNTKIKFISLLSALVLWLYVMAVEDPTETKTYSNIPINITNIDMVEDRGLAINPNEKLFADISIDANLSSLRRLNSDNIYIYCRIDDPKEGNNTAYLQANLSERVNKYDIKPHSVVVNLEKLINEEKTIKLYIEGTPKVNIDTIDTNKQSIEISGPKSLVNEVTSLIATIDLDKKDTDFSTKLKLTPVNKDGKEVKGVNLEENYIIADVKLLKQKTVPVKLNLEGENVDKLDTKYNINPSEVTIEGKQDLIDSISIINTQPIKVEDLNKSDYIEIPLEVPKDITLLDKIDIVKIQLNKEISTEILVPKTSIEFRNRAEGEVINLDKVPDNIKVMITHSSNEINIGENDIKIYVDLLENDRKSGLYSLKYTTLLDLYTVKLEPEKIRIN